jgi:hypothetical protein
MFTHVIVTCSSFDSTKRAPTMETPATANLTPSASEVTTLRILARCVHSAVEHRHGPGVL